MSQATTAVLERPRTSDSAAPSSSALLALAGLLGLAHLPLLILHGKALWNREHYQLFPLVLIFAVILARPAYEAAMAAPASARERRIGMMLLGLNWLLLAIGVILDSPVVGALAFWVLLIATAVATGGWQTLKAAIPALVYLLLIIPPPFNLDGKLVLFLQSYTSRAASRVLDQLGVYHALTGVVVEVGEKKYEIEQACSGISSLLSVLACTLFYVFWMRTHWLRGTLLVLASIFWVLINNVTRVVAVVFFDTVVGFDLGAEPWHTLLGIVLFAVTLGLLVSTDRLLLFVGSTIRWGQEKPVVRTPVRSTGAAPLSLSWGGFMPAAFAYGLLLLFQAGDYGIASDNVPESKMIAGYNAFNSATMPDEIQGWKKSTGGAGFATRDVKDLLDIHGAHSRTWQYHKGNVNVQVSFDYPFPFWHDLRICYTSNGWTVESTDMFNHTLPGGAGDVECTTARLSRPVERNSYLWFGEFDLNGRPVEAKDPGLSRYRFVHRIDSLKERLGRLAGNKTDPEVRAFQVLQVQAFAETVGLLSPAESRDIQGLFASSLELLREKCRNLLQQSAQK